MAAIWDEIQGEDLIVDGCIVPHIQLIDMKDDYAVTLVLDNRFSINVPKSKLTGYSWFLANAMARAAGYTCHGLDSHPVNLYARPHPDYIHGKDDEDEDE